MGDDPSFLGVTLNAPFWFRTRSMKVVNVYAEWWVLASYINNPTLELDLTKQGYGPFTSFTDAEAWLTWATTLLS